MLSIGSVFVEPRSILQIVRVPDLIGFPSSSVSVFLPELSGPLAWATVKIVSFSSGFSDDVNFHLLKLEPSQLIV